MSTPTYGHFHRHAPKAADLAESRSEHIMAWITAKVGTLACAIGFAVLAGLGAPAKFSEGTKGIIEWLAQQFLQLVLLAIILGGQKVTEKQGEKQTEHIALGIDTTLDAVSLETEGGLQVIDQKLDRLGKSMAGLHGPHGQLERSRPGTTVHLDHPGDIQ